MHPQGFLGSHWNAELGREGDKRTKQVLATPGEPHLKAMCSRIAQTPEVTVAFPDTPTGHTSHRATVSLSSPGCPRWFDSPSNYS